MVDTLRLGFIGLGMAVTRIFTERPGITDLPHIKLTAAADPRRDALAHFEREFGADVYDDVNELVKSSNVDAVYVATPPEMHAEHALLAMEHGKHVIVEKPIALTIDDCERMNEEAERRGLKLLAGHTHSFDPPIRKMREIIRSGELGGLRMVNTWNYNEFMYRPWPSHELVTSRGILFNQAPHQVDIVRLLGGGLVRSVRAMTGAWDELRPGEGAYTCYLEFEDGVSATLVYNGYGFFDTAELCDWVGEGGYPRDPETNRKMRANMRGVSGDESALEEQKNQMRYGARQSEKFPEIWNIWGRGHDAQADRKHQKFFGLTVASCEKGDLRQSADGILVYGEDGTREVAIENAMAGRQAEVQELYEAVVHQRPVSHDGRWGEATLEVCLAMIRSAEERREIVLSHQVPAWE